MNEMALIEIKNLIHHFPGGLPGLNGIDLAIDAGEFVVIAGENGSGKTTLLRHLNGLLMPTEGEVSVAGFSVVKNPAQARQTVGMVFQDPDSQIVGETVADDVAFGPENLGLTRGEIDSRVIEALAAVGLTDLADRRPHTLSGGEKRRVAIAGVLAMKPSVMVFDEPFDSLDYPGVRQILGQIVDLHNDGRTVIVTTHDVEKVIAHAGRLVILKDGKVARNGQPSEVLSGIETLGVREPCASRQGQEVVSWLN